MTKYLLIIWLVFYNIDLSFGDEPPSWRPYKVFSQNKKYFCWIDYNIKDTSKSLRDIKWRLSVYSNDSILIWYKDYKPTGYPDGLLSDDGNKFVYVEFWYFHDANLVKVTRKDQPDISLIGQDFHIPGIFLQQTVSHKLWLEKYDLKNDRLTILTRDGRIWLINLQNGSKELIGFKFNSIHIIIGIILILLIIVTIIVIKKKRKKKITTANTAYNLLGLKS